MQDRVYAPTNQYIENDSRYDSLVACVRRRRGAKCSPPVQHGIWGHGTEPPPLIATPPGGDKAVTTPTSRATRPPRRRKRVSDRVLCGDTAHAGRTPRPRDEQDTPPDAGEQGAHRDRGRDVPTPKGRAPGTCPLVRCASSRVTTHELLLLPRDFARVIRNGAVSFWKGTAPGASLLLEASSGCVSLILLRLDRTRVRCE